MFVALRPGRAGAVARCQPKARSVAGYTAVLKGQARRPASVTVGSDTVGTVRKRAPSALLRPRNAEQRPANGWRRFPLGTGTRHALRSRAQPPNRGWRSDHARRDLESRRRWRGRAQTCGGNCTSAPPPMTRLPRHRRRLWLDVGADRRVLYGGSAPLKKSYP
jgi:hypothetical protein